MAAACRCPRGQQRFFSPPILDRILPPTTVGHTGATLSPPPQTPPDKRKGKGSRETKGRKEKYILGRARPALLAFRLLPDTLSVVHFRPSHS